MKSAGGAVGGTFGSILAVVAAITLIILCSCPDDFCYIWCCLFGWICCIPCFCESCIPKKETIIVKSEPSTNNNNSN